LVLKNIEIFTDESNLLWVKSGLTDTDVIVSNPSSFLKEGQYVEY